MTLPKQAILTIVMAVFLFTPWAMASQNDLIQEGTDWMKVDNHSKSIVFSATVMKYSSKAAVTKWGQRGQAWIGTKDGSEDKFFIFTTDVSRVTDLQRVY